VGRSAAYAALKVIGGRFSALLVRDPETHCISFKAMESEGSFDPGGVHPSGTLRESGRMDGRTADGAGSGSGVNAVGNPAREGGADGRLREGGFQDSQPSGVLDEALAERARRFE
jgi:hypothetical protein